MPISPQNLAAIWRECAAGLGLLARTRCSTPEDCVQEAFLRLAQQPSLPPEPRAWLVQVVRHLAINSARSESRRISREDRYVRMRPEWFFASEAIDSAGHTKELEQSLLQLEPEYREIVVAHLWNGLTFRQIAEAFDISSSKAHRDYLFAIESLRRTMKPTEIER